MAMMPIKPRKKRPASLFRYSSDAQSTTAPVNIKPGMATLPSDPSEEEDRLERKRYIWVAVVVGVLVVLLTAIALVLHKAPVEASICSDAVCSEISRQIVQAIDLSVDPCINFHKYVCGRWRNEYDISVAQRAVDVFENAVRHALTNERVPHKEQKPAEKAAAYYQSCMRLFSGGGDVQSVRDVLRSVGLMWPHAALVTDVLVAPLQLNHHYAVSPGISCLIEKKHHVKFQFSQRYKTFLDHRWRMIQHNTYRKHFDLLSMTFAEPGKQTVGFEDLLMIEQKILPPMEEAMAGCMEKKNSERCQIVVVETHNEEDIRIVTPNMTGKRWRDALEASVGIPSQTRAELIIRDKIFFRDYFGKLPEEQMHMYQGWIAIQDMVHFTNSDILKSFYGSENNASVEHGKFCFSDVKAYFGYAAYSSTVTESIDKLIENDVSAVFDGIINQFTAIVSKPGQQLMANRNSVDIFDYIKKCAPEQITRAYRNYADMGNSTIANRKTARTGYLSSVVYDIRPPKFVTNSTVHFYRQHGDSWNAFMPYSLYVPMYDIAAPAALKYGALGSKIAVKISALMLNNTSNFIGRTWVAMEDGAACVFGRDTRLENATAVQKKTLERLVSLRPLYKAFRAANVPGQKPLPGMTNLSDDMLFFVFWCYVQCEGRSAPFEQVCNEVLKHSSEFATAYNCAKDTAMKGCPFLADE
ncbi:neprilysin-like [Ornithodoros turicata]|uniref:neprilysin-like n=1 Tax=Ornithodoros turicata TaxID=34597 RepID=UPI003139BA3A